MRTKADERAIDQGCYWDQGQADRITRFAEGVFAPQYISGKFQLLDWQRQFLQSLYGWRDRQGNRRWKYATLHIPKKNGKTLACALVSAYELVASGEPSPFVVTGSVSKENAGQIYSEIRHTLERAGLAKHCKITPNLKRITIPELNAEYRALASDGDRTQGYNCSLVTIDEAAWHKNSGLYDSLKYAHIARPNGLLLCISTSSDDPTGYYHGVYQRAKRILAGEDLDTTTYCAVYESEPDADPEDPKEWAKANPSLGVSFSVENFQRDLTAAKEDPAEWLRFLRYRLCRWTRADELAYFDLNTWDRNQCPAPANLAELPCWVGVDLSMTTDPSSVSALFDLGNGKWWATSWAWVADEGVKLREKTSFKRFQDFATQPNFEITEGDMIDADKIEAFLIDLTERYKVRGMAFDPTSAYVMMHRIQEATGVDVVKVPPTYKYLSAVTQHFRKDIQAGHVSHDGNEWLRYCLSCVRVDENTVGEIRPSVRKSTDHIDGLYALLLAYYHAHEDHRVSTGISWL